MQNEIRSLSQNNNNLLQENKEKAEEIVKIKQENEKLQAELIEVKNEKQKFMENIQSTRLIIQPLLNIPEPPIKKEEKQINNFLIEPIYSVPPYTTKKEKKEEAKPIIISQSLPKKTMKIQIICDLTFFSMRSLLRPQLRNLILRFFS